MRYMVHFVSTVTASVEVEADSPAEAVELAEWSDNTPHELGLGTFGSGDWEAVEVSQKIDDGWRRVWKQ